MALDKKAVSQPKEALIKNKGFSNDTETEEENEEEKGSDDNSIAIKDRAPQFHASTHVTYQGRMHSA